MPTNRSRRPRCRQATNGLAEATYSFFGSGPFFDGEKYELQTTETVRGADWKRHREAIIARWRRENPQHHGLPSWGEMLEKKEIAEDAHE